MGILVLLYALAFVCIPKVAWAQAPPTLFDREVIAHIAALNPNLPSMSPPHASHTLRDALGRFADIRVTQEVRVETSYLNIFKHRGRAFDESRGMPRFGFNVLFDDKWIIFSEPYGRDPLSEHARIIQQDIQLLPRDYPIAFTATVLDRGALGEHISDNPRFGAYFNVVQPIQANGCVFHLPLEAYFSLGDDPKNGRQKADQWVIAFSVALRF